MPRKPKPPHKQTTDEALRKLFPKEVVKKVKEEAKEAGNRKNKSKST